MRGCEGRRRLALLRSPVGRRLCVACGAKEAEAPDWQVGEPRQKEHSARARNSRRAQKHERIEPVQPLRILKHALILRLHRGPSCRFRRGVDS